MNMSVARIVYDQVPEDYGTAYHEYGHFIEWNKVGFIASHTWTDLHWFQRETEQVLAWNEGWAEFYCAATYNYWYKVEMPSSQLSNDDLNVYIWMDYSPSVLSPSTDHHKVEGAVACFFYSLWDGVNLRSPNYTGDNDDISYSGSFILNSLHQRYNTLGQLLGSTHIEAYKNALLNSLDIQNDASVNALYNWLILQSGTAKSATPTNVSIIGNNISRTLTWNDNTCSDIYTWPTADANLVENNEQGFRIYMKATSSSWDGTLNGYSLIATCGQNVTSWIDNALLNGSFSYVVVAFNSAGNSLPSAEHSVYYVTPSTPTISISGGFGDNPTLTFSGGGPNVSYYKLKKEYNFGAEWGTHYVNPASNPYTDYNVLITKFGGDVTGRYSVQAFDHLGNESNYSNTVSTIGQSLWKNSNVQSKNEIIIDYVLFSNYPNPFNPSTQISYQIPKDGFVNLIVYNTLGQKVAELVNQEQSIGKYSVKFDASNLPSGVYIYKLHAGEFSDVKKMLLTK